MQLRFKLSLNGQGALPPAASCVASPRYFATRQRRASFHSHTTRQATDFQFIQLSVSRFTPVMSLVRKAAVARTMMRKRCRNRQLFTPEVIKSLIEEVKQRSFIWDTEDIDHNHRGVIASAWADISKQLGIPEALVKIKWKTVRDTFMRDLRRYQIRDVKDYRGKWRYFHDLWFLCKSEEPEDGRQLPSGEGTFKFECADASEFEYEAEIDPMPIRSDMSETVQPEEDYDLMFLKSLTPYLRQVDPLRKLVLRNKIQDMILSELSAQMSSTDFY